MVVLFEATVPIAPATVLNVESSKRIFWMLEEQFMEVDELTEIGRETDLVGV
jgi:hypothetical protein